MSQENKPKTHKQMYDMLDDVSSEIASMPSVTPDDWQLCDRLIDQIRLIIGKNENAT